MSIHAGVKKTLMQSAYEVIHVCDPRSGLAAIDWVDGVTKGAVGTLVHSTAEAWTCKDN